MGGLVTISSHFYASVISELIPQQGKSLKENDFFLELKIS